MAVTRVANSETFKVTTPADREIVLTRLFGAPPALVFEAMTRPEHVRRWWWRLEPGYAMTVCEIDLRVGGAWHFVGQGPKGECGFHGEYREIAPPGRIVFTEIYDPFPDTESIVTSVFSEEAGKTRMTMTALYPSKEVRDIVVNTGMESGAAKSYDQLEELLQDLRSRR